MEFQPIYYADKLKIFNKQGDVGVVTLWSPSQVVIKHLKNASIDLDTRTSRIAVVGTLYGDGLPEMLRNLMHNPQIHHLVLFGVDLDCSRSILTGFFERGLESVVSLGVSTFQIVGTEQKMDNKILPEDFHGRIVLTDLGRPSDADSGERLQGFFNTLSSQQPAQVERRTIPIPELAVTRFPSTPQGHTIVADTPLEGWRELVHTLYRFGYRTELKKGLRMELQNIKVVINQPGEESEESLEEYGFSLEKFKIYQKQLLSEELLPDQHYSYGHRLRGYFSKAHDGEKVEGPDTLAKAIEMLIDDPESRHAYIALWDTARDLLSDASGHPCLVSLYFRRFDDRLTMTAIFRTHNALKGWLQNLYGLMAIQRHVADGANMEPGPITVMSQSISIAPQGSGLDFAKSITAYRERNLQDENYFKSDPHGEFLISVDKDEGEIIVDHRFDGMSLHRYRGRSAKALEKQLVADKAISDIGHALYLGREMSRAELSLKKKS